MNTISPEYDAVVIGGRVAGAGTAMLLARLGHSVLVVDRAQPGRDTLSTHALGLGGVVQLHRWGLLTQLIAGGAPPARRVDVHSAADLVSFAIEPCGDLRSVYAPRRTVLDPLIAFGAAAAGATVRYGVAFDDVIRGSDGRVAGVSLHHADGTLQPVRSRLVIGADGTKSRVARAVDAGTYDWVTTVGGTTYSYWSGLPDDAWELHVSDRAVAGVFPTHGRSACVFVNTPADRLDEMTGNRPKAFRGWLAELDTGLAERLERAQQVAPLRMWPGEMQHMRQPWGPGWALVGDAGLHQDPFGGHGITNALRDAELLAVAANAVLTGASDESAAMSGYHLRRDELARPMYDASAALAGWEWDTTSIWGHLAAWNEAAVGAARAAADLGSAPGLMTRSKAA